MANICVFSGSANKTRNEYVEVAKELGKEIVKRKHNLVYGGSRLGLMGVVSKTVRELNGHVIGIVPKLFHHLAEGESELILVKDFAERLTEMELRSQAFITLPGGVGSLFEIAHVLQARQVNSHLKPLVLLNTLGFYDNLVKQLDRAIEDGFIPKENKIIWHIAETPEEALDYIDNYKEIKMPDKIDFAKQ